MPVDPLYTCAKFYAIGRNESSDCIINPEVFAKSYLAKLEDDPEHFLEIHEHFNSFVKMTEAVE